jgi:hypothetical protein
VRSEWLATAVLVYYLTMPSVAKICDIDELRCAENWWDDNKMKRPSTKRVLVTLCLLQIPPRLIWNQKRAFAVRNRD